jgi:uncharacterized protein (TIGR02186 family)
MIRWLVILVFSALPATAEQIVLGLSQNEVAITTTFDGSEILIFGAIKRDRPPPDVDTLGVIVTISGPSERVTVRRKDRVAGIWVNNASATIDVAPSFFAVASNLPLNEILTQREDRQNRISLGYAVRTILPTNRGLQNYIEALLRVRQQSNLYQVLESHVEVTEGTLFRATIEMPSNLIEGEYRAEIYLTRAGEVVDVYRTRIPVQKVGPGQWFYTLAHQQPAIYGLISLAIAVAAGWLASAAFGLMRR